MGGRRALAVLLLYFIHRSQRRPWNGASDDNEAPSFVVVVAADARLARGQPQDPRPLHHDLGVLAEPGRGIIECQAIRR
jgi:hypothetical protein